MPIKTETNVTTGQVELVCKSNGVTTTVDKWKPLPPDMLQLNPNSDEPDKKKDQMIYIDQKPNGIMIVDSDKLDPKYPLFTMHEQAWMYKNLSINVPMNSTRPVCGLSASNGKVEGNSGTFNEQPRVDVSMIRRWNEKESTDVSMNQPLVVSISGNFNDQALLKDGMSCGDVPDEVVAVVQKLYS